MREDLPTEMVAALEGVAAGLGRWARQHPEARLADLEQTVLQQMRAALPTLLGALLRRTHARLGPSRHRLAAPCPRCRRRQPVQSWRVRQVLTVCGGLRFERPWYTCRACRQGWSPTDQQLGLAARQRLSPGVRTWLADLGQATSFAEAAARLEELTGLAVSPETLRQHSEAIGAQLEQAQQAAAAHVLTEQEPAQPVEPVPGLLVVEADGVMLRYRSGWHEVKLGVVGGQMAGHLVAASYVAARASPEAFGPLLLAEAARRGALAVIAHEQPPDVDPRLRLGPHLAVLRKAVVLGDGAVWIWRLAAEHFGERVEILDYYHTTEHLWTLARAFYGEGSAKAARWARRQCGHLLEHGPDRLLRALRWAKPTRPEVAEVLRRERGYFTTNAARMDYPAFRAQELPIGSGAAEGAAKHPVQQRLKRPGARWSDEGAQAILTLRAHRLSGRPLPLTA